MKDLNFERFTKDVSKKLDISSQSFGDNMRAYNEVLRELLDEHAPIKTRTIKVVPNAPWFNSEYVNLRKLCRNLCKQTVELAHQKKCKHYGDKLEGSNSKILYSTKLLDNEKQDILPDAKSDAELANSFLNYFTEKTEKIRATFQKETHIESTDPPPVDLYSQYVVYSATEDEISQIVLSFGVKCSPDDPLLAADLKTNLKVFIPIWTKLVNHSLEEGTMDCMKKAVLILLIKQLDEIMDKDNHKNYQYQI